MKDRCTSKGSTFCFIQPRYSIITAVEMHSRWFLGKIYCKTCFLKCKNSWSHMISYRSLQLSTIVLNDEFIIRVSPEFKQPTIRNCQQLNWYITYLLNQYSPWGNSSLFISLDASKAAGLSTTWLLLKLTKIILQLRNCITIKNSSTSSWCDHCSQVWWPCLIHYILLLKRVQQRGTKYILNNHTSSYCTRLLKPSMLPLYGFLNWRTCFS